MLITVGVWTYVCASEQGQVLDFAGWWYAHYRPPLPPDARPLFVSRGLRYACIWRMEILQRICRDWLLSCIWVHIEAQQQPLFCTWAHSEALRRISQDWLPACILGHTGGSLKSSIKWKYVYKCILSVIWEMYSLTAVKENIDFNRCRPEPCLFSQGTTARYLYMNLNDWQIRHFICGYNCFTGVR